ncbi:hypothetical protein LEMLEM_LOCUS13313, partial [Lemmus lemmus]
VPSLKGACKANGDYLEEAEICERRDPCALAPTQGPASTAEEPEDIALGRAIA